MIFSFERKMKKESIEKLRPTSTSIVLVDVRVYQVRMLFINRACAQDKLAGRPQGLPQMEDGLYAYGGGNELLPRYILKLCPSRSVIQAILEKPKRCCKGKHIHLN